MAQHRIVLGILVFFSGQFGFVSTQSTNVCKTFGSGVMQTFNGTMFHVKTTCPVTLTHFSHAGVDCFISVQRDQTGIMKRVEILVNKIATIIQDGILTVEGNSISLPYDHTYQKVYAFGIYTKLTSKVLPFSVTWYSLPMGVTRLQVQLDRPLVDGMTGMCGRQNSSETRAELLDSNVIPDKICVTGDSQPVNDKICNDFKSSARECLGKRLYIFDQLCKLNMYINIHESAKCSFYEEFFYFCNQSYALQTKLRNITSCKEHHCPGDLLYKDQGAAFPPTCSNPQLQTDFQTSTCLPPNGLVLNDRVESYYSVKVEDCPCVHRGNIYAPRDKRSTKCQTCECIKGKWICSANTCMTPCIIEGWFVTTFDGKQYSLPGTCTYVASRGLNWTITVRFSAMTIEEIYLDVYQERYIFSLNSVQLRENEITATDLSQTEHVTVYWQSSMFVIVQTSFGMKMQVQVSPEVQMYLYLLQNVAATGLCGSNNNNTKDDFTTSSGIVENSAQPFALSWTLGDCTANNPYACINTNKELFAEDKCSQLTNTSGVFALCHEYVPVNSYLDACIRRTCQASSGLQEHVCVGLGNYAKACASQGIIIGDWRAETACTPSCESNLRFDYTMQACNHTCRSLSGPDPTCDMPDDLVEGCGCPPGTHLNTPLRCSPRALCQCNYPGGTTPPGPVVIDGRQCMCENGYLQCSDNCDCPNGQICVHCAQAPVNTVQRTCESLSKPSSSDQSCISGCYCPEGQYADHNGHNCVTRENCTCEFSGMVYASGQAVESNCKTCTCRGGQWDCKGDPCPGVCEVFGNGQYKTFDSKWYRFDGHCQYTLAEDINGLFSINAESVPCCDEVLTCSRAISVKLKDEVTLTLRDMNITQKFLDGWRLRAQSLYSVHTVGLYIIISVPELGLRVIWDKQTKVTIELQTSWNGQVRGLCGDFDGKLMNDLLTRSSTVVFSTLEFGNSWKTAVPPCSDVTQELFPCERHSYCAAWAQRRCMILQSDTFKACHLKVDPTPYYQACILESCSCDFEGKFLGFCTAVAAYADACTTQNVCIKWRTPDLCPVYCDYYNEEGQCSWHYEACPQHIKTCGKNNRFSGKLEGCYPQCPSDKPYYDENRRICSRLDKCTCYFNNTVVEPGANVTTYSECCECIEGQLICVIPVCPRGMPKLMKDKQGCCDTWQCDCQCDVFGDPHYTTFAGQDFTFLENCTYVLVEERTPLYHLSISIDNYYCEPSASCAKGIIVQYQNNTVMLQVVEVPDDIPILQMTLNQVTIKAPYQAHGLRFESTDAEVYIYIKEIRSYISLSVWNTLQINLAMEHFFNNTHGQCGVCGGASCIRRNGTAEREDCCDKTAYEWIENDPLKPYCQQAPRHVLCFPDIPTISPGPTTSPCKAPLCDLLRHQVFSECSGNIDVEKLVSNCKFDYCMAQNNASVCSQLERLADHCKKMGTCVAWRNLTSGICDNVCPEGMIFDECRSTPTDFCRGGVRVSGTVLDTVMSGCFCPNNQLLAERHKTVCVSECTNCKGPLGEPMLVGETWESNCHMCTCNNQTLTEECWPKPTLPSPICSPGFALISDCCDNQICVEKTCEYSGTIYKVGETWRDPKTPCLSYRCTSAATEIEQTVCPQQFCPEELRVWDENHCCYSCNTTCGVKLSRMTFENCTQEVMLPTCEGNCASGSL
ncbi:mucin-2-like [Tachysurus ichikawai]